MRAVLAPVVIALACRESPPRPAPPAREVARAGWLAARADQLLRDLAYRSAPPPDR